MSFQIGQLVKVIGVPPQHSEDSLLGAVGEIQYIDPPHYEDPLPIGVEIGGEPHYFNASHLEPVEPPPATLEVDDEVVATRACELENDIPAGTPGRIIQVDRDDSSLPYYVQFDEYYIDWYRTVDIELKHRPLASGIASILGL